MAAILSAHSGVGGAALGARQLVRAPSVPALHLAQGVLLAGHREMGFTVARCGGRSGRRWFDCRSVLTAGRLPRQNDPVPEGECVSSHVLLHCVHGIRPTSHQTVYTNQSRATDARHQKSLYKNHPWMQQKGGWTNAQVLSNRGSSTINKLQPA